jgi:hypothetical protein
MDNSLLEKLAAATSDAERESIVLDITLNALPPALHVAIQAAAIPHWFDFTYLSSLIGEDAADDTYDQLVTLSFVDTFPGRGYAIHETTRNALLNKLWNADPHQFRTLSDQAADYCLSNATTSGEENYWRIEEIYHRLVSDPEQGIERFQEMATAWANYEQSSLETIERIIQLAREQVKSGRLTAKEGNLVRLWQARLGYLYGRTLRAAELIAKVNLAQDADPAFAADLADLQGDIHGDQNDLKTAEQAWNRAIELYSQTGRPFDRYLVQEKLRTHGLLDQQPTTDPQLINPPDSLTLKLLDNIEDAWINGVLKEVFKDDKQSLDLPMARGSESNLSGRLRVHRPGGLDQDVAGQGLSGLFEASGRSLLILGAPGSGKTITLLQLLDELIKQARVDAQAPVPLLFNLSSFGKFEGDFVDWLAEQAYNQYRLGRKTTLAQLKAGRRFVLLLDGLDELPNESQLRDRCVQAINSFSQETLCGLVICSRITDYKSLNLTLDIAQAIILQPLTNRQIEAGLIAPHQQRLAHSHWQLKEALRSPLLLTLFTQANTKAVDASQNSPDTVPGWQKEIFAHYVSELLPEAGPEKAKPTTDSHWLTQLAQQLQQAGTTVFNIEDLQPTWLSSSRLERRYLTWSGLLLGLIFGLSVVLSDVLSERLVLGLIFGLSDVLIFELIFGLIFGLAGGVGGWFSGLVKQPRWRIGVGVLSTWLIVGLIIGLIVGLIVGLISGAAVLIAFGFLFAADTIEIKDKVILQRPIRAHWWGYLRRYGSIGLIFGLTGGLIDELIDGRIDGLIVGLIVGLISGMIGGLIGTILSVFDTPPIDKRSTPAQGVRSSLRNAIVMTAVVAIGLALLIWPIDRWLDGEGVLIALALMWSLPIIFALYGGVAWCQHWALQFVLYWHRFLPFRLVPWLNRMVTLGLLRRVGGGYIFLHRSLLEYFASLNHKTE